MSSDNNKRIARNTSMLYFRMLLTMAVSLYTSRIVLNTLGVEDFGIYNVVGGFVTMFGFLNTAMASATQRFLSYEIGRNDIIQLGNVFSMSVNIHFLIAFLILILAETLGLWFLNTQLNIPSDRMVAARWVYQFSVFSLMVNMVSVPYNAMIIAHERMNVFAWVSIIEVSLKLLIVFVLQWFGFDKLKFYAILMFGITLVIRIIYGLYCKKEFKGSQFRFYWNKPLYKTLVSFAGWNLWGNIAGILTLQGTNILLNIFFGPIVNAARGIAFQIRGAVNQFVYNFQMAMNPQIIKSYAANDLIYTYELIFKGAKYSFLLLFLISLPIILETPIILRLWLHTVPEYTVIFTRLVIINILIDSISGPLMVLAQATGKIKFYQGVVGGLLMMNLPISYFFLKFGFSPEVTVYISIIISITALYARLLILKRLAQLNIKEFFYKVLIKILLIAFLALIPPSIIYHYYRNTIMSLLLIGFISVISVSTLSYLIGLDYDEKKYLKRQIRKLFTNFTNRDI